MNVFHKLSYSAIKQLGWSRKLLTINSSYNKWELWLAFIAIVLRVMQRIDPDPREKKYLIFLNIV